MGDSPTRDPGSRCAACKGEGWIVLLVSRKRCQECRGTGITGGRFDADDDGPEISDDEPTPPKGTKI